jgi:hypothetical protein
VDDVGTWEALIGVPTGIEHAHATLQGAPELAIEAALRRAEQELGSRDWTRWRFRAELCSLPVALRAVHFHWNAGKLVREPVG